TELPLLEQLALELVQLRAARRERRERLLDVAREQFEPPALGVGEHGVETHPRSGVLRRFREERLAEERGDAHARLRRRDERVAELVERQERHRRERRRAGVAEQ